MRYHDPGRPRGANGLPVWKDAPHAVLPRINIIPDEEGRWRISLMVPIGSWGSDEASRLVELDEVYDILLDWEADPEGALSKWWGRMPVANQKGVQAGVKVQVGTKELDI